MARRANGWMQKPLMIGWLSAGKCEVPLFLSSSTAHIGGVDFDPRMDQ